MACTIVSTPATGAADWTGWITQQGLTDRGFSRISLTNFATTAASVIGTGSVFELAGSIYNNTTGTSIALATGTASANVAVYYVAIPSAGGTACTFTMDSVAPTWVDAKQGYYASAASTSRYLGGTYIGTAATYYKKWLYHSIDTSAQAVKIYGDGSVSFYGYYFNDVTAGANLLLSEDTERITTGQSYVKLKEIICSANGIATIKFDLQSFTAGEASWGRIYINGIAVGTEQTTGPADVNYYTKTEDIAVGQDDLLQIYGKTEVSGSCRVKNFQIYCDEPVGAVTLKLYEVLGIL